MAETGCYADFTLPSAPDPAQISKINALYKCGLPLNKRAPHRRGRDLKSGHPPAVFPLMVQGPLGFHFLRSGAVLRPYIENSGFMSSNPPTLERFQRWRSTGISVIGQPDWVFVKLHCHGMDPRDRDVMLGRARQQFLGDLVRAARMKRSFSLHFVSAREMVNIILAACDGRTGNPSDYRDYRLQLIHPSLAP